MSKYATSAFRTTKVSFMHEVANLCELVRADSAQVAYSIGLNEHIGTRLSPAGIDRGVRVSQRT